MGAALWKCDPVKGDVVVPVPDSGNNAAIGYAEASGIPFDHGLTRNHYAGRSFIMPTTAQRELAVRMKLHPIRENHSRQENYSGGRFTRPRHHQQNSRKNAEGCRCGRGSSETPPLRNSTGPVFSA